MVLRAAGTYPTGALGTSENVPPRALPSWGGVGYVCTHLCHSFLRWLGGTMPGPQAFRPWQMERAPGRGWQFFVGLGVGDVAVSSSQSLGFSLGVRVEIPFLGVSSSSDLRVMADPHIASLMFLKFALPLTHQSPFISVPCDS